MIFRFRQYYKRHVQVMGALILLALAIVVAGLASSIYYWLPSPFTLIAAWLLGSAIAYTMPLWVRLSKKYAVYTGEHQAAFQRLAEKAGVNLYHILVKQSPETGAWAISYGNLRSVTMTSALLDLPAEQVEAVFAHELGHHARRDSRSGLLGLLLLDGLAWISHALGRNLFGALLISSLLAICLLLLATALSRWKERRADRYAANLIKKPQDLAAAFTSMTANFELQGYVIREEVPFWVRLLETHPPMQQRIRQYQKTG